MFINVDILANGMNHIALFAFIDAFAIFLNRIWRPSLFYGGRIA